MRTWLIFVIFSLIGCSRGTNTESPQQYTANHPGVKCTLDHFYEDCNGGYYTEGRYIPQYCHATFRCSDGKTLTIDDF